MIDAYLSSLTAPFQVDTLLDVRTSKMKSMPGLTIMSGIDKASCNRPMKVSKLGLEGDEHDLTFHGGADKAILGYCSSHYDSWRESYPERAERFIPGGFGENFVTAHMNERNVCVGDVISVGPEVVLQVSLPRQPCFKLNHRFSLKKFAPVTYQTSRTGWYYRVLQEGTVRVGDELRLVERKWPEWTIERVQEYLHRNTEDLEMNQQLAQIEALGAEAKGQFQKRVVKAQNASKTKAEVWRDYRITQRKMETPRILSFKLEAVDPENVIGDKSVGLHARLKLPNGITRAYSIVAGDGKRIGRSLEFGVALDENSRGGSRYLHTSTNVGDIIQVGNITQSVGIVGSASKHIFVAGGIGITAFLALASIYRKINYDFELHYAVRSVEDIPFQDRLADLGDKVTIYDKSNGQRMDIRRIVKSLPWNSQLYFCGPERMMEAAKNATVEYGVPPGEVHFEAFSAETSGDPFEVEVINKKNKILKVGENETLLDVLKREFDDVASSCEVGNCGTCKVAVRCGKVQHRGTALTEEEDGQAMLSCVSRGVGRIGIEI